MELGTYRLAEINKGGGLRQKAVGLATQYLNGIGEWVDMPTAMTPTAHTHLYAGSDTAGGAATTATKLATTRALTIGNTAKNFDGSQPVSWTLAEIGANQWKDGIGSGAIMTSGATAAGLRSSDGAKPYVYWNALAGQDLKAGGLAGTDQKWMLISPSTVATYAYGGEEYTYNNATANYVFLILIDSEDFIGSATNPFNRCRIIANAGTNYLSSYRTILTVGTPITGNVYPVIVSTGNSTAPSGITYTESVSLSAPLKSSSTNYTGNASVASGLRSVASGANSVASGTYSVASGGSSVAFGTLSVASGTESVAFGTLSVASGDSSVASGDYSVASGLRSVASGANSVASGPYSVASGFYSVASGGYSVASGLYSVASGFYSVASGGYSVASGDSQTVIGKYNVANTSSAFIIGNGTSTSARSNCMTVDFSGNMTLAGSISIGATGDLTISKNAGADRIAYFDSNGVIKSSASYTLLDFASAGHNHSIPDLYCGVPYIVPGRILISGSGGSSNPTWLDAGTNGKILGWTSGAPAWVDAPYAAALHTHLYAGSAEAGGAATTATKLATTRALTIGNTAKNFDGSASVSWTLAEIGANQWKDGIGTGAIMTKNATAAGLRSGDVVKPYVLFTGIVGKSFKSGGLAGTDQSWAVIPPNTNYTYAYGVEEYAYNNTSSNYIFLAIILSEDFIGSTTSPFNRITLVANGGTKVLSAGRTITNVSNITGNAYSIFASAGTTQPTGIDYTQAVTIYAFFKNASTNYLGDFSVASGNSSVASGSYSVASGDYSVASGLCSVASGNVSVASGFLSVASGNSSVASGSSSVASGAYSVASGDYSVASGLYSVASGGSQTVIGKYNVANTSSAFIIGNGTSEASRANCMTVDFSGNMTLAGSVKIPQHAGLNRLAYFDENGVITSSASYTLLDFASASHDHDSAYSAIGHNHTGVYSLAGHNHDSTYLKLSGGTVTGKITLDSNGGIYKSGWDGNRIAYFVSGDLTTSSDYTTSSFALAGHNHDLEYAAASHTHSGYALADHTHSGYAASTHNHSIPDLYCGVPDIVPGRILISGSGGSSNPTWLDAGTNGKILGWTSGAPAWVDAPSGSTVSPANPTASVGLTAVNGSAATFMRSDAAPKLDVSISPTWTGTHTFSGLTQLATVGIGVAPSTSYKLYVVEDKEITTAGSYIGNYLIAKYNTDLSSGTRQGIALLGQLWANGGTLTHAKGLDFKVYVPSGTVQEAIAINAVIQTDGGSIETAYALKLSRSGTAPTVKNYGIYQDDSAATNVFNGPCQFNGGTNIPTGRVRNFLNLSAGTTLTPDAGTDLLVFFETSSSTIQTLILPSTSMAGRAGDIIRVVLCGNCKLTFSTGSGNNLIKPAYYGATANYYLTTQSTTGDWTFICDGTNWRAQMLSQLFE